MAAERIPQSTAIRVVFNAVLSSNHASPATGKTVAITISKNGAAFANPAAGATTATELSGGAYYVDLAAADVATLGPLIVLGTASATDNVFVFYDVVAVASAALVLPASGTPTSTNFLNPTDIGNRALQHCGAARMDPAQGFAEVSRNAAAVSFCYPKLRRAELQRNVWEFAIRDAVLRAIDTTTMLLAPALYASTTTYFVGSIVADENGQYWISIIPNNLGFQPETTPSAWVEYFGPLTVTAYDSTLSYFAGELVYSAAGDGTNRVYLSLISDNTDDPATATAWSATATYYKNQVVTRASVAYMSRIDLNTGNDPTTTNVAAWASGTTYAAAAKVTGSDGVEYSSIAGSNTGNDPVSDGGVHWADTGVLSPWNTVFTGGAGSLQWLQIGGAEFPYGVTLSRLGDIMIYPLGAGPSSQSTTRNVFRLPAGFLRKAPSDPKAGSTSYLGAPYNLAYTDWTFRGSYIISAQSDPIMLWFVADVVDVSTMNDMFCEGLAARIAVEIVEELTQSADKLKTVAGMYDKFMSEARMVNAILTGSEEPPLDDFIACRA